jgi:hypothetical protein
MVPSTLKCWPLAQMRIVQPPDVFRQCMLARGWSLCAPLYTM